MISKLSCIFVTLVAVAVFQVSAAGHGCKCQKVTKCLKEGLAQCSSSGPPPAPPAGGGFRLNWAGLASCVVKKYGNVKDLKKEDNWEPCEAQVKPLYEGQTVDFKCMDPFFTKCYGAGYCKNQKLIGALGSCWDQVTM